MTDGDRGSDVDWVESTEYGSWGVNYLFGEWLIQPKGQSHVRNTEMQYDAII